MVDDEYARRASHGQRAATLGVSLDKRLECEPEQPPARPLEMKPRHQSHEAGAAGAPARREAS